uniref:GTP-binding protein n=1 Tax=Arcella intermedia TaxID=1963864 RepID=A0A6B2LLN7_9EUKA
MLFKLVLAGELGVGKSSIALQYLEKTFTGAEVSNIGSDFRIKQIDVGKTKVKLQIYDTAGQEKFRTVTVSYFRAASAVILVLDVTNPESLANMDKWIAEAKQTGKNLKFLILANKVDLERKWDEAKVRDIMRGLKETDFLYRETSAKTGQGVTEGFKELAELLVAEAKGGSL